MLNLTSRDYFDDIVDGVPSSFIEDNYDDENSDDEEEIEIDY